jgi:hypothetical protein
MTHAREDVGGIALDLHAAATAEALLAAPKFAIYECLIDHHTGGQSGKEGDERFTMGLSGCVVAQHGNMAL